MDRNDPAKEKIGTIDDVVITDRGQIDAFVIGRRKQNVGLQRSGHLARLGTSLETDRFWQLSAASPYIPA